MKTASMMQIMEIMAKVKLSAALSVVIMLSLPTGWSLERIISIVSWNSVLQTYYLFMNTVAYPLFIPFFIS